MTRTCGCRAPRALHHLVVVGRDPDDPEVLVALDEGAHPLADDEVVIGEEHRDRAQAVVRVAHRL